MNILYLSDLMKLWTSLSWLFPSPSWDWPVAHFGQEEDSREPDTPIMMSCSTTNTRTPGSSATPSGATWTSCSGATFFDVKGYREMQQAKREDDKPCDIKNSLPGDCSAQIHKFCSDSWMKTFKHCLEENEDTAAASECLLESMQVWICWRPNWNETVRWTNDLSFQVFPCFDVRHFHIRQGRGNL